MKRSVDEALRMSNRHDLLNVLGLNFTNYLFENGWFSTCLNCHYWQAEKELCGKFNARPPAKIIAFGCEKFSDEHWIPF